MKPIRHCLKKGRKRKRGKEYNGGGEHIQNALYACKELS
jgi:hypothetical protein